MLKSFFVGEAIICYQCNSEYDPRCGDPFDPYSLGTVNCSFQPRLEHLSHLEPTLCRKISQRGISKKIIYYMHNIALENYLINFVSEIYNKLFKLFMDFNHY